MRVTKKPYVMSILIYLVVVLVVLGLVLWLINYLPIDQKIKTIINVIVIIIAILWLLNSIGFLSAPALRIR